MEDFEEFSARWGSRCSDIKVQRISTSEGADLQRQFMSEIAVWNVLNKAIYPRPTSSRCTGTSSWRWKSHTRTTERKAVGSQTTESHPLAEAQLHNTKL